jgi:outer membrane protein assembly factor BamB
MEDIMKYLVLLVFLVSLVSAQTVINAIPAPRNASGLCWANGALWCGAYGTQGDTIYKFNPVNGDVIKKFKWRNSADCYGLAFDTLNGGSLWVSDHSAGDSIFLIDTIAGERRRAFRARKTYMAGLANDGHNLWNCCYYNPDGRVYGLNKVDGVPFDSFDTPQIPQPWGATWDGNYLWVCNDGNYGGTHSIYKINTNTHQIVDSFTSPGTRPMGLAWDGTYLWVTAIGPSPTGRNAYQIDLTGSGTPDISILPTSNNYGNVAIGTSPSFSLTIYNLGTDTLTVSAIFSQNAVFSWSNITLPAYLPPNSGRGLDVSFTPTVFGAFTSNLGIVSDDPDEETVYCALKGQGVYANPTLLLGTTSYNFGDVRVNCVKDFFVQIVNRGLPTLIIDSIKYTDARFFSGRTTLPISLGCLETTEVQVITRPSDASSYSGHMLIYSNSTNNPHSVLFLANGTSTTPTGGQLLWSYSFPDNIVCVAPIADINNDSIIDIAAECYGTNMTGEKHLRTYWGNSSGSGVVQWGIGDNDFTGGYGDDCLVQGDDYNNDGKPDLLLGTAWGDRSVYAINALNGQILWFYDSHSYDGDGGWVYSVKPMPDINNDGIGEVLAGIGGNQTAGGGPRSMYCFSGANGSIIWQFRAQDAIGTVNWIPDVNGDGITDAVCGAWGNSYDKRVYCVSGASSGLTTTSLWQYQCGQDVQSVITIPDLNGDGKLEVVAGSWNGIVYCFSGANGNVIWTSTVGGWVVKVVAIPDLIGPHQPGIAVANVNNVSFFNVLNSTNGNVFWSYPTGSNVWTCDAIEDLNSDGKMDVICGNQTPGTVFCLSGATGNLLWSYLESKLIYSIRAIRDISGDGHQDVLVGTQGSTTGTGHLLAISGGYFPQAVNEPDVNGDLVKANFIVFPRLSRTGFNIRWSNLLVDKVTIFDASGKKVKELLSLRSASKSSKVNAVVWNGRDELNRQVAEGIYFVKAQSDNHTEIEKIVVVK